MNITGVCDSRNCKNFGKKCIDSISHTNEKIKQLSMSHVIKNSKCPDCKNKFRSDSTQSAYFFGCSFKTEGLNIEDREYLFDFKVVSPGKFIVMNGEKSPQNWTYLMFTTEKMMSGNQNWFIPSLDISIKKFCAYEKNSINGSRYVALLSDNSIWWFAPSQPWLLSSMDGFPKNKEIELMSCMETKNRLSRYFVVLSDNTIWWFIPDYPWNPNSMKGLPNKKIKMVCAFEKGYKNEGTRCVVVLSDNSIWWNAPDYPQDWIESSKIGLPNYEIKLFCAFERNVENGTRYVVVLSNETIWWFAPGSKWEICPTKGIPSNRKIISFSSYEKGDEGTRFVVVLDDNSIYWYCPNIYHEKYILSDVWQKISPKGLPPNYQVKSFSAYYKYNQGSRYVLVLSDDSIYWCDPTIGNWMVSSKTGLNH